MFCGHIKIAVQLHHDTDTTVTLSACSGVTLRIVDRIILNSKVFAQSEKDL